MRGDVVLIPLLPEVIWEPIVVGGTGSNGRYETVRKKRRKFDVFLLTSNIRVWYFTCRKMNAGDV